MIGGQRRRRFVPAVVLGLGLLAWLAINLGRPHQASWAQEGTITLTAGENRVIELTVSGSGQLWDSRIFTLNAPVGSTVWISIREVEDACCGGWLTGVCNNVVRLKQPDGTTVSTHSEGTPHGQWSDEEGGYMTTGTATLGLYRSSCLTEPNYPYTVQVRMRVIGAVGETETTVPPPPPPPTTPPPPPPPPPTTPPPPPPPPPTTPPPPPPPPPTTPPPPPPTTPAPPPPTTPPPPPPPPRPPTQPPPEVKLLVVTHSGALNHYTDREDTWTQVREWLDDRYGPEGYDVVDLAESFPNQGPDQWQVDQEIHQQWPRAQYWAIFVIGGHNVVPFALGTNPVPLDGDYMWTDDLYADFTGDWVPDTPLARLPDVGDFSLLQTQLAESSGPTAGGGFVLANEGFTYAEHFAAAAGTHVIYSPPFDRSHIAGMNSAFAYFDLGALDPFHPQFNRVWFGCSHAFGAPGNCGPVALSAEDANTQGVVVSAAHYAGFVGDCDGPECWNLRGGMPHQFLANGAQAYIGTLVRNYLYGEPVYIEVGGESTLSEYDYGEIRMGIPLFTQRLIGYWGSTSDPLVAFYLAKVDMLRAAYGMATSSRASVEQKMGHGLVYYGVPGRAVDCPACLSQTAKPVFPNRSALPEIAINVERPLHVLEVIDPHRREVRETGAVLTQGCGFLDCNSTTRDSDKDGLSDALEWRLTYEFEPFLEFDEQESANPWSPYDFDIYHQVSPSGTCGAGAIVLTYILAYDQDYGSVNWGWLPEWATTVFEAHSGDTEMFRVRLRYEFEDPILWVWMDGLEIKRHHDEPESYPPVSGGGPYLYISRDKHAAYTDLVDCGTYAFATIPFEECGDGPRGWASHFTGYLRTNHNVGEVQPEDLEEGEPYNGTRHWQEYTHTFNGFPLWDMEERFCGNLLNCAAVWEWTPVGWLRSIPYVGEPIVGRFVDKGGGPFGPKWQREPSPIVPPFHSLEPCP